MLPSAKLTGLSDSQALEAIRGRNIDAKVPAALKSAKVVVGERGRIDDADFQAVIADDFTSGGLGGIVAHVPSLFSPATSTRCRATTSISPR